MAGQTMRCTVGVPRSELAAAGRQPVPEPPPRPPIPPAAPDAALVSLQRSIVAAGLSSRQLDEQWDSLEVTVGPVIRDADLPPRKFWPAAIDRHRRDRVWASDNNLRALAASFNVDVAIIQKGTAPVRDHIRVYGVPRTRTGDFRHDAKFVSWTDDVVPRLRRQLEEGRPQAWVEVANVRLAAAEDALNAAVAAVGEGRARDEDDAGVDVDLEAA